LQELLLLALLVVVLLLPERLLEGSRRGGVACGVAPIIIAPDVLDAKVLVLVREEVVLGSLRGGGRGGMTGSGSGSGTTAPCPLAAP
jgi:hypothetical protein